MIKAIIYNFLTAVLAIILTLILGGPKISIAFETALVIFLILAVFCLFIIIFSLYPLISFKESKRIIALGPYGYVRHPIYSAIIFILNPALAILFRSWLYLIACLFVYFIWKKEAEDEELLLKEKFGKQYLKYSLKTPFLFPNLFKISKIFSFVFIGIIIFILTFIGLNLPSFYYRFVQWEPISLKIDLVEINQPLKDKHQLSSEIEQPKKEIVYNEPNSIVINKIGLKAPLILSLAKSQKEINEDLNKGVVIYPGSVLPGQIGNLFLTGHSSVYPWNKTSYGQVFALLDKLEKGDRVVIFYEQRKYEYEIENKYVVSPKEVKIVHSQVEPTVSLMTCWPIGTTWKRLIVEGKLVAP